MIDLSLTKLRRVAFPPNSLGEVPKIPDTPADIATALMVRATDVFLDMLPPSLRELLGFAQDAASAITELKGGNVGAWLNVIQQAQKKWINYIDGQWDVPEQCRSKIRGAAAKRCPEAPFALVSLKESCGTGDPPPGKFGWKPSGIGKVVYQWALSLPPTAGSGSSKQTWLPDPRKSRSEGFVFCPATFPYCIPHTQPWTWDEGVMAVMAVRYQNLLAKGFGEHAADYRGTLDELHYRLMAIINAGRSYFPGEQGSQTWDDLRPVKVVSAIPGKADPAYVYATPHGEIWSANPKARIRSYWNTDLPVLEATVGQLQQMLASIAGLALRDRMYSTDPVPGFQGTGDEKGSPGGGGGKGGGFGGGLGGGVVGELDVDAEVVAV
ncbi:MAG: hypothetical protein KC486_36590, partial [Myxococcales bacterium]|nr:hypothetical protein [Myxococcales bacterium]